MIGACAGAAAASDVMHRRVPNRLAAAVLGAGLVASIGLTWGDGVSGGAADRTSEHLERLALGTALAVAGCVLAGIPMLLVRIIRGLGMGDVKLAGALGASLMARAWWLPLAAVAVAAAAAATAGGITGRSAMPLAPFLAVGWLAAMLLVSAIPLVTAMPLMPFVPPVARVTP
ncbi:MAG: prepilin peptidase [Ilumatobacteraceae bacterium]